MSAEKTVTGTVIEDSPRGDVDDDYSASMCGADDPNEALLKRLELQVPYEAVLCETIDGRLITGLRKGHNNKVKAAAKDRTLQTYANTMAEYIEFIDVCQKVSVSNLLDLPDNVITVSFDTIFKRKKSLPSPIIETLLTRAVVKMVEGSQYVSAAEALKLFGEAPPFNPLRATLLSYAQVAHITSVIAKFQELVFDTVIIPLIAEGQEAVAKVRTFVDGLLDHMNQADVVEMDPMLSKRFAVWIQALCDVAVPSLWPLAPIRKI